MTQRPIDDTRTSAPLRPRDRTTEAQTSDMESEGQGQEQDFEAPVQNVVGPGPAAADVRSRDKGDAPD